jgi:hypothetical protein
LLSSLCVLVQVPEHSMYGAGPQTQAPLAHVVPVVHVVVVAHVPVLSHCCTAAPLHCTAPGVHPTQLPFRQTGLVAGQAAQFAPQCAPSVFVLYAHGVVPPHVAKPALQLAPHVPPLHVATPLTAAGHCVQFGPQ